MLEDLIQSKTAFFADGAFSVLRGQENRSRRVTLVNGNMTTNSRKETKGVNARVCINGSYGFSSVADYSAASAEEVIKAATDNARMLSSKAPRKINAVMPGTKGMILPYRNILDVSQKRIIDACREMDDYVASKYPDLTSRTITYTEDSQDKIIYTSDNYCGHVVYPRCYMYVEMCTETKDGTPIALMAVLGGAGSFEDNFSDMSRYYGKINKTYTHLMDKKEGVFAEAGLKTVILGGEMTGMLAHEAVGHTVEADLVLGGSVAGPNLNKRVGSDLVNMVDFANTALGERAPLPVYVDDEGTFASDAVLIKDGILTGYMNDRESAARYGVKPVGNARGWEFSDEPLIRMRNTAVLPGKDKLEDIIASVDDGYYLLDSNNGQADLTGEFMFGVTLAYEIKHGKIGHAILDTTVSGVAFDLLKTVDMVSDNMTWSSSGFCGKKQWMPTAQGGPELRCKMMIGGR